MVFTVADDSANDVPQQCDTDQARQKGDRFKSGDDPLEQLDEIEKAQRKVREGKRIKSSIVLRNQGNAHAIDLDHTISILMIWMAFDLK